MPAQEGQFGLDGPLVAIEEGLIMPAWQPDELSPGSTVPRRGGWPGRHRLILVADDDQQWAAHPGRVAAGPVEREPERRAGGGRLLPVRVPASPIERFAAAEGVRRAEDRDGPRRKARRAHQRGVAAARPGPLVPMSIYQ